jgi:hypothetical protein
MSLELIVIPVSDAGLAKLFYGKLGWKPDLDFTAEDDFRVIQFTPSGSPGSVIFGAVAFKAHRVIVAALGVGGAPGGDKDEVCARAGVAKVSDRLPR